MNLFTITAIITAIIGFFGTIWAFFRYVLVCSYRLEPETSKRILTRILSEKTLKYIVNSQHVLAPKLPETFSAISRLDNVSFFFSREERLLNAGWKSKEDISQITFLRWNRQKIDKILTRSSDEVTVPVSALSPSGSDKLGEIIRDQNATVYMDEYVFHDIEQDVTKVISGELSKTSMLLYGDPGNGKTQFVKYLAKKYNLPINIVYFSPDYTNIEISTMFANIPSNCIVLLEDFDTYFNGRECLMKNEHVRFTFDSIINALDGAYNDYKGVVFVMTANDIEKIDTSLKMRPSRFKFVRQFSSPSSETRMRILNDLDAVKQTSGLSLDQVFSWRDTQGKG
jgi:hypothetical protein